MIKILFVVLLGALSLVGAQDAFFSQLGIDLHNTEQSPPMMAQLLNGNILLFGAGLGTNVFEYNLITNVSVPRASLPHNIYEPCVFTTTSGKIYVVGGLQIFVYLPSVSPEVLIYDPVRDTWDNGQNMTTAPRYRSACGYDPLRQNIHMLGGVSTLGSGDQVHPHIIYSITNDTWRNASNPPIDNGRLGRAYYEPNSQSMVFVGGAFTTAQSVYHTDNDTWTQLAPIPDVTYYFGLVVRPDRVLLLGGADKNTLFTYYIANDTWTNGTLNAAFDFNAETAVVGGSVFAIAVWPDYNMYVSRCLVPENCDGSNPCLGSCAAETGFCAPLSNVACDDGNACTLQDTCYNGVCVAGNKTATQCLPPTTALPPSVNAPNVTPSTVPITRKVSDSPVLGKSMSLIFMSISALLFV